MIMRALLLIASLTLACGTAPIPCTTMNCVGCCDSATSKCLAGTEATACGTKGNLCIACPGNQTCAAGLCKTAAVVTCNASNCNGCCDNTGTCFSGTNNGACGRGGASCITCVAPQSCLSTASGGSCG